MKVNYLKECLEKFALIPEELRDIIGGFEACEHIRSLENKYQIKLALAVILVAINELNVDELPDFLRARHKLSQDIAQEITNSLAENIFDPALDYIIDMLPDDLETESVSILSLTNPERREIILNIFEHGLVETLAADAAYLQELNVAIFKTTSEDEELDDKLLSLLYNSSEKITSHHLILDGHPSSPTIANWLKDFIKKYGSDIFNEIILAEYLSMADSIKVLPPTEKDLIRRLLKLYFNLAFFPESMDGVPLEKWAVFPVDEREYTGHNNQNIDLESWREEGESPINKDKADEQKEQLDLSTEAPKIKPVLTIKQNLVTELEQSLHHYSQDSLEYKAIFQEINRLNKK